MRLGVSENLLSCTCSRWVSSETWQEGMPKAWHAAARQGLCGSKQKASKKCSTPTGAMKEHLSSRTQSPFQASMHQTIVLQSVWAKECSTEGHCHPLRSQRHIGAGRPLDFASTKWGEYSNTRQHTYLLECPRVASELCRPSAGVCASPQP